MGFDNVTINDLAAAAGVSRSTFLRYFGTKEEAVLRCSRRPRRPSRRRPTCPPRDEDDWTALRRALDPIIEPYHQDAENALATTRLVTGTPALCTRQREKQHGWRSAIEQALAERAGLRGTARLAISVKVAAALDCLNIAVDHWIASDGRESLVDLFDDAFAALAPR